MSKDKPNKKGIAWFKSNNSKQSLQEQKTIPLPMDTSDFTGDSIDDSINGYNDDNLMVLEQSSSNVFAKDNQDKIVLDLLVPFENMLKDRQLILYKNQGLEEQLHTLNDSISRLKQDQMKKDQQLQEKNKAIRTLENNLTNKQMSYDQLLDDYKEYQTTSNFEYERISNLLDIETNKYHKLNEEATNTQYQNMLKTNELEEKIRNIEIEAQRYLKEQQKILADKAELMQTINDFTERMSFSFSPKSTTTNASDSE